MSGGEVLIILIVALVVFGPKRLPELGRAIGKVMHEFNKALHDVKDQMDTEYQQPHKETTTDVAKSPESGEAQQATYEQQNKDKS